MPVFFSAIHARCERTDTGATESQTGYERYRPGPVMNLSWET